MTKPVAVPADAESLIVDYLKAQLPLHGQDVTCGAREPTPWADAAKSHVQVALDGIPNATYAMTAAATIRLTAWTVKATDAKALCGLAQGIVLAHGGGNGIQSVNFLTGTLPTRDADTGAQLATCTVRVNTSYTEV